MAMLAERREKKRYVLMPRGKPLFNDSNRFGTKMLEKMGWSKGKGLGANENGSEEFVRIRYKNNNVGLGYKDRDDQWTENEDRFDYLLKSLNNSANNSDSEQSPYERAGFGSESKSNELSLKKFESLEEKSKSTKSRVHYRKFTKSKDLSQYSEKDLANIFGKKYLSTEPLTENENASNLLNSDRELSKEHSEKNNCENEVCKEVYESEEPEKSNFSESNTKKKKKKSKTKDQESPSETPSQKDENTLKEFQSELKLDESIEEIDSIKKKSKKRKLKDVVKADLQTIDTSSKDDTNNVSDIIVKESSKKKRKTKQEDENNTNEIDIPDNLINSKRNEKIIEVNDLKVKKKKKSKHKKVEEENQTPIETTLSEEILVKSDVKTLSDEPVLVEKQKHKKHKQKKAKTVTDLTEDIDTTETSLNFPIEESKTEQTIMRTSVETNIDKYISEEITKESENIETIQMPEIEENVENFLEVIQNGKIYVLNALQAEIFRSADFRAFKNSNIYDLIGYGLSEDIQLQVKQRKQDEIKICNLWLNAKKPTSKYKEATRAEKKKNFQKYVKHLKKAHSFVKV